MNAALPNNHSIGFDRRKYDVTSYHSAPAVLHFRIIEFPCHEFYCRATINHSHGSNTSCSFVGDKQEIEETIGYLMQCWGGLLPDGTIACDMDS